jgi:prepilin-type N-terminal cleavage/methylation domain-containing protein
MQRHHHRHTEGGFSLIEVLVAIGIIVVLVTSVSQLFAVATRSNVDARVRTAATLLATEKLEELRELAFGFDSQGATLTDVTTDTSAAVMTAGGTGLMPGGSLDQNVAGYSDSLDLFGRRTDLARADFVRRWAIEPLRTDTANGLVLSVVVLPRRAMRQRSTGPDVVRLVTVRTRKSR